VLGDLELGTARIVVRAGAGTYRSGGFFEEQSLDVALTEPVRSERTLEIHPTGRISVRVVDSDGKGVVAECALWSSEGRPVAAAFARVDAASATFSPKDTLAEGGFVTPSPPPGHYRLAFTADGFFEKTVEADVVRGQTTEVVVPLVRR